MISIFVTKIVYTLELHFSLLALALYFSIYAVFIKAGKTYRHAQNLCLHKNYHWTTQRTSTSYCAMTTSVAQSSLSKRASSWLPKYNVTTPLCHWSCPTTDPPIWHWKQVRYLDTSLSKIQHSTMKTSPDSIIVRTAVVSICSPSPKFTLET
jgi:hypothetical protein